MAAAFAGDTGIGTDLSCRMACAFGAGGGRRQGCCGAVSGALLVISLLHGRGHGGDKNDQEKSYALVREYVSRFEGAHCTIDCKKLLDGVDLLTEEGQTRYKVELMHERCLRYVADSVAFLEGVLGLEPHA